MAGTSLYCRYCCAVSLGYQLPVCSAIIAAVLKQTLVRMPAADGAPVTIPEECVSLALDPVLEFSLPHTVDFTSFASFKRTIAYIDFSDFLKVFSF